MHDNPAHHALQAELVAQLGPAALVFEMLEPRHVQAAQGIGRADIDALNAAFEWDARGWPDFSLYHPIFAAASDAALFGAGLPRGVVRRAVGEGAASVYGQGAAQMGLAAPLDAQQQATREELQQTAHCNALPEDMLPGMVEAQRLRDAVLARATIEALTFARRGAQRGPVVVITGNGHARNDWGMPAALRLAAPGVSIKTLAQFEESAPQGAPFDYWVVTDAYPRQDPCDAFK